MRITGLYKESAGSLADKRRTIITVQWLVAIGTSYLVILREVTGAEYSAGLLLVLLLVASAIVLQRAPNAIYGYRYLNATLISFDTVAILGSIGMNLQSPWDWFMLFFFCLFIAGIGESVSKIVVGCLLLTIALTVSTFSVTTNRWFNSEMLLSIPFIFVVSMAYGFLAEQVKKEKRRTDQVELSKVVNRQLVSALVSNVTDPLTVVVGSAEVVALRLAQLPDQDETLAALQRIRDNVERVLKLVMGFLDTSIALGRETERMRSAVQLNRLIRDAAQQQTVNLRKKNLQLNLNLESQLPEIMGDEQQLEKVLSNLVTNVIKRTQSDGTVTILSATEHNQVRITIQGMGLRIPETELPLLFSESHRSNGGENISEPELGLFVVKTIVESHGATFDVESEPAKGTFFVLRFPIRG